MVDLRRRRHHHLEGDDLAGIRANACLWRTLLFPEAQLVKRLRRDFLLGGFDHLSETLVAISALPLLPPVPVTLFPVRFQVARQFDDDLDRLAVGLYEPVDDAPDLVQPEVHGGVGDAAVTGGRIAITGVRVRADHVAFQHLSVVGQKAVGLGVAEVGVVRITGGDYGF